jgi:multiple sugar transport system permease protein
LSISTGQAAAASASARADRPNVFIRIAQHRADYLYIAPALLVMLLVIAYPVWFTIQLSFEKTSPSLSLADQTFIGFDNYWTILKSQSFRDVTVNTLIWTVFSTLFSFLLGLGCALALNRAFIGRGVMRAILLIPYVISAVAASYIWRWLYHSDFGVIGALSVQFGLTQHPINFLDNTTSVLPSLIVVNVWKEFSFAMIMLMAGLQTVPDQLLRAAQVDGASTWNRFWHVTFPHLRGVTLVTVLLLLVANLNSFIIPWIMTGGGPAGASDIWITSIYNIAFGRVRFGIASAYSVILFLVMIALGYFYVRALAGKDDAAVVE